MEESAPDSKLEALFLIFAGALAILLPFIALALGVIGFLMWLGSPYGGD